MNNNYSPSKTDLSKLPHKLQVMFATFCAEQVFHLVKEKDKQVCRAALDTAKSWVFGEGATAEDCKKAADAAYATDASAYAAANAANAAAYTAYTAAYTAYAVYTAYAAVAAYAAVTATNKKKIIEEQWNYYHELLAVDEIVEKNLIGDKDEI